LSTIHFKVWTRIDALARMTHGGQIKEGRMNASLICVCSSLRALSGAVSVLGMLALLLPSAVSAQQFPARPVRFLIPLAPGGDVDITVRAVTPRLSAFWGQLVVVDNRPGGTGAIALEMAARARPDGYTIALITGTHTAREATHAGNLPYGLVKDFAPVT